MLLSFRYYSILYVFFSILMLGFRFYSVFMCVCFFPECFMSFFLFLCVYMFIMMSCTSCVFNKYLPLQESTEFMIAVAYFAFYLVSGEHRLIQPSA